VSNGPQILCVGLIWVPLLPNASSLIAAIVGMMQYVIVQLDRAGERSLVRENLTFRGCPVLYLERPSARVTGLPDKRSLST
jgi:hypothetical protein